MATVELPGAELVERGVNDLATGLETVESLLVSLAAPRLRALGFDVSEGIPDADLRLYQLLAIEHGNGAHSKYNALIRRIVSFQRSASARAR